LGEEANVFTVPGCTAGARASTLKVILALRVHQDGIVLAVKGAADRRWSVVDPYDLIQQALGAEDLIQQKAGVSIRMPIQVQVQLPLATAGGASDQAWVEHIQIGVHILPVVGIALG
jgi:hypothetical protein